MRGVIILLVFTGTLVTGHTVKQTIQETENPKASMQSLIKLFGNTPEGQEIYEYKLINRNNVEVSVINYGGIITSLKTPDRNGVMEDIVLGYDSLNGYLNATPYFGAIVGRYANRIAKGKFSIDEKEYTLARNNNGQHLHGGIKGFDKVFWNIEPIGKNTLKLTYLSKDMEEGYPGNLSVTVMYTLTDHNELHVKYEATSDKKTIVNLTQHSYFNLTGNVKHDILDHEMTIYADRYIPVDEFLIPTGKLQHVTGTPFDFRKAYAIGSRILQNHEQLKLAGGYDHCWVLSGQDSIKRAAFVVEPVSGRTIEVLTTEPGIQVYCGNFLDGSITGKGNVTYKHRYGFCLETEHFPDSPNQKGFPPVELYPGEIYKTETIFKFGVR